MSALAQQNNFFIHSQRRISELDLLRVVSTITWTSAHEESALTSIAAAALRLPGLIGLRFEPLEHLFHLPIYESTQPHSTSPRAFALATVSANGRSYGQLRIFFDPHSSLTLESPVRLAKFIGQQLGLLLHRIALNREYQRHSAILQSIDCILRRRKVIHRAAVILAEQRNTPKAEAISFMVGYARRNRRSLLEISEALIFGYDSSRFSSSPPKVSPSHVR